MRISRAVSPIILGLALAAPAPAFHDRGVGPCNGCHTMHNSPGNPARNPSGSPFLLRTSTPTDTCLRCHERENGNSWGTSVASPGPLYGAGQFVFLLDDNLNDGKGGSNPAAWIPGHQAGHSVVSLVKGTSADPVNRTAPGGTYLSANLHCTSCHDPHGKGGSFRFLHGTGGWESRSAGYVYHFIARSPDAEGIPLSGSPEAPGRHCAYRAGVSEWCANCHGDYHAAGYPAQARHPAGTALGATIAAGYNAYEGTGHPTGDGSDAYLTLVPVEDPAMTTGYTGAVSPTSRVMCLTCHRAHASSAPDCGRWDFNLTTWLGEGVESGSWPIPNPYAGTAGPRQRSLCNKCHQRDPQA